MRYLILLFLISPFIYSNEIYYRSNNSGIQLEKVEKVGDLEYYLVISSKNEQEIRTLYNEGASIWIETLYFNNGSKNPYKREKVEGRSLEVETYRGNWKTQTLESYKDNILEYSENYFYDTKDFLEKVVRVDGEGNEIYVDTFFRGPYGELRVVERINSGHSFKNRWFYQEGAIIESWYIDDISSIRTIYSKLGDIVSVINYDGDSIVYSEEYIYNDRQLEKVIKTSGDNTQERSYNLDGFVTELKIKEKDILVKRHLYGYSGDTLISEKITGHGMVEEYIYTLNTEGDVILISYLKDRVLVSNTIKESDDVEIKEFFKDGTLFLREYYRDKEKIQRELFIDGVLFKSEKFNE